MLDKTMSLTNRRQHHSTGLINQIRTGLQNVLSDTTTSRAAFAVALKVIAKFTEEFGSGIAGTVFTDHIVGGPSKRLRGYQLKTMVASALDPRTKSLVGNCYH